MSVKDVRLAEPGNPRVGVSGGVATALAGATPVVTIDPAPSVDPPVTPGDAAAARDSSSDTASAGDDVTEVVRRERPEPRERRSVVEVFRSLLIEPDTMGPRVRLGVFWFLLLLAAATSSRQWVSVLVSLVAAIAAYQVVRAWRVAAYELPEPDESGRTPIMPPGTGRAEAIIAALAASLPALASGVSTGLTGALFIIVALLIGGAWLMLGSHIGSALAVGVFPPSIAAVSIVLAVRQDLWAGIFLVVAVSFYDAGSFLLGSEAAKRWEGPIGGMMGVMAVTFTVATVGTGDLSRSEWWIAGLVVALLCPPGQWLATWMLPDATTRARGLRRLDAYLLSGPAFLAVCWFMGG